MTNALQVFKNTEFGEIRTIQQGEDILFVAADVCKALELGQVTNTVRRLDADEKALISIKGINNGNDKVNVVNEYGLYSLVLSSRKPEAKAFKRWITHEVIPAIRKTGKYAVVSSSPARGGSKVKYYKGIAVITKKDLAAELGTQTTAVYYYTIKPGFMEKGKDYFTIGGTELAKFKKQNGMSKHCTALTIVTSSGVSKIYEAMGKEIETAAIQGPKDIAKAKFKKLPLEIQRRIETMAVDEELMDQYENAIMKLSGETASVVEDLLERYAELYHSYYSNEEKLTTDGIEADKRLEYHKLYREAYGKGATA